MNFTVTETCSCGARLEGEAYTTQALMAMLHAWRAEHQHTVSIFQRPNQPPKPKPGDRVEDGGRMGTIVTCPTCDGDGILHDSDEKPEVVQPQDGPSLLPQAIMEAWGIIANAGQGDWSTHTDEWCQAAYQWRDRWVGRPLDPEPTTLGVGFGA